MSKDKEFICPIFGASPRDPEFIKKAIKYYMGKLHPVEKALGRFRCANIPVTLPDKCVDSIMQNETINSNAALTAIMNYWGECHAPDSKTIFCGSEIAKILRKHFG